MFQTLLESQGRGLTVQGRWAGVSAAVHAALITMAVVATMNVARVRNSPAAVEPLIYVAPTPVTPVTQTLPSRTDQRSVFIAPVVAVPDIPVPRTIDFSPTHIGPSIASQIWSGSPVLPVTSTHTGAVFTEATVDRIVAPRPGNPSPKYPATLRSSGLPGTVVARFVVDTNGVVERGSVTIVEATHPAFADAVREWLPTTHYYAAEAGGRRVRQLVQQRVEFQLR